MPAKSTLSKLVGVVITTPSPQRSSTVDFSHSRTLNLERSDGEFIINIDIIGANINVGDTRSMPTKPTPSKLVGVVITTPSPHRSNELDRRFLSFKDIERCFLSAKYTIESACKITLSNRHIQK